MYDQTDGFHQTSILNFFPHFCRFSPKDKILSESSRIFYSALKYFEKSLFWVDFIFFIWKKRKPKNFLFWKWKKIEIKKFFLKNQSKVSQLKIESSSTTNFSKNIYSWKLKHKAFSFIKHFPSWIFLLEKKLYRSKESKSTIPEF